MLFVKLISKNSLVSNTYFIKSILGICVVFFMIVIYLNSFIPRYNIGSNLDDKMVVLLSSQYSLGGIHRNIELFDTVINKCKLESKRKELCLKRNKFRANSMSTYMLSGILIDMFVKPNKFIDNLDISLSRAMFYGLSLLVFIVFLYVLVVTFLLNANAYVFVFISFVVMIATNPYFYHLDASKVSDVLFMSKGDGYLPMIYVPRGAVSYLLLPILFSIVYKKNNLLLVSIIFASLIHSAYGLIFSIMSLIALFLSAVVDKPNIRAFFYVVVSIVSLLLVTHTQTVYKDMHLLTDVTPSSPGMTSFVIDDGIIRNTFFLLACLIIPILYMRFSFELKRYAIVFLSIHILVFSIVVLESNNLMNPGRVSERVFGSFSDIYISLLIYLVIMFFYESLSFVKFNKSAVIAFTLLLIIGMNIDFSYIKKHQPSTGKVWLSSQKRINQSLLKINKIDNDVQMLIDEHYSNDKNLSWLRVSDNKYILDRSKIEKLSLHDVDINNEFLVFLKLYLLSKT